MSEGIVPLDEISDQQGNKLFQVCCACHPTHPIFGQPSSNNGRDTHSHLRLHVDNANDCALLMGILHHPAKDDGQGGIIVHKEALPSSVGLEKVISSAPRITIIRKKWKNEARMPIRKILKQYCESVFHTALNANDKMKLGVIEPVWSDDE